MTEELNRADELFKTTYDYYMNRQSSHDPVNHPSHYTEGEIECIDALESALGVEGFRGYCIGNAMKYLWRYNNKGGLQDLSKSEWYLARAKQHMEKHNDD